MRLAYFSPVPWASFRQRPHEFVEWFHGRFGGEALWVDPYPIRLPRAADLKRPRLAATGAEAPPTWLRVHRPRALPLEPLAWGRALNAAMFWHPLLRELEAFCTAGPALLAIAKPADLAWRALQRMPHVPSLYDAMDDFAAFHQGPASRSTFATEANILRQVRLRTTSSSVIAQRLRASGWPAQLVPNGVAAARLPQPGGVPQGPFGYVGTVAAWFDWEWLIELATAWPERRIEIHGPVFRAPTASLPANVQLHPALPHAQALERMRGFALGLIPFLRTPLTASVDPVKYYEYRALGLPVLATPFGEMAARGDEARVLLTERPAQAGSRIAALLASRDTAESVAAFRLRNDWSTRFEPLAPMLQAIS